jgi:hypothetical protein
MNFFGHVVVATWQPARDARTALGAMLPDLVGVAGLRGVAPGDPEVARGVALHHRTDEVFHASDTFVSLQTLLRSALEARGIRGGPARAAAHVGIELLLDGLLLDGGPIDGDSVAEAAPHGRRRDPAHFEGVPGPPSHGARTACALAVDACPARTLLLEALQAATEPWLVFDGPEVRARFAAWVARARALGLPEGYGDLLFVRDRVIASLSRRPRLAVPATASAALAEALREVRPAVEAAAPGWLSALRRALAP